MKLLMFLLLITLPALAPAQFTFTTNNGTITITGYTGKGGSVVIPAKINGWPVTAIGSIGQPGAFEFCSNLTKVTIPTNVRSIGSLAFFGCPKLTNVLIADGVTSIDPLAFTLCTRLKAITVSPNNRFYSTLDGVLFNRNKTTLVQYPGGLRASYVIPSTVKSISEFAFESALVKNITIPDSVTNIGFQAFCAATNLVKVTIPKSVVEMGIGVFWYCSSLKTITVAAKNPAFSSLDGVLFDKRQTTLIQYPGGRADGYIMPASVTNIGYLAFAQCSGLKGVTIDDGVTTIQSGAFSRCTSLANIVIPNNVTSLDASTFYHCTSLTNISIGNSVANIEVLTFCGCSNLLDVTIPASVTNIAASAFADCTSLTSVYFEGNAPEVEPTAFIGDDNASAYYLPGATGWSGFASSSGIPTDLQFLPSPWIVADGLGFGVQSNNFSFAVAWATNVPVVIEACTNLSAPVWQPVQTNTPIGGSFTFSDPQWTNFSARYYRLSSP